MNQYTVTVEGRDYDVDAPDDKTAWLWANQFHKQEAKRRDDAVKADQAAGRAAFEKQEAARPWGQRALANLGAGFDTAWQGAKQLGSMVGIGEGVSDDELRQSRSDKQRLAESTGGGGLLQLAGEVAPTVVAPLGAGAGLARLAVAGAAGGAAAGALQPVTSDESRAGNIALGAAGGAVAPAAFRAVGKVLPLATARGREAARTAKAGRVLTRTLGNDAGTVAQRLEAQNASHITGGIPLTAAEKAGDSRLARMELAARKELPEEFAELGRRQNDAIYDAAVNRAGVEGTDQFLNIAKNARDIATSPLRDTALQNAGKYKHLATALQGDVDAVLQRAAEGSPAQTLAGLVQRNIDAGASPEKLYDLRKLIQSKLSGPMTPGDDVAAIVKGAEREAMGFIKAIDRTLDNAASRKNLPNAWLRYLDEYKRQSPAVSSSRAQQQINEVLSDIGRPTIGGTPEVSRSVLSRALGRFGETKQGFDRLTPGARSRYDELLDFLNAKEEPMRTLKLGGTGGGGSQTSMQLAAKTTDSAIGSLGRLTPVVKDILARMEAQTREEVAGMLLDPQAAAAGIRAALSAGKPMGEAQQAFLAIMRASVAGTAGSLGQVATAQQ